ncbi:MAG: hypothetical protein HF975_15980 [ANME-2 cluster archaeon]|nr:hypothetical protein [ANME-2 cluster archaeon]
MLRIAWGITGCGDQIEETFAIMKDLSGRYDLEYLFSYSILICVHSP